MPETTPTDVPVEPYTDLVTYDATKDRDALPQSPAVPHDPTPDVIVEPPTFDAGGWTPRPPQPLDYLIGDEYLPHEVRPLAAQWRDADGYLAKADDACRVTRAALDAAPGEDRAARHSAALGKAKTLPAPGAKTARAAAAHRDATDRRDAWYERKRQLGAQLVRELRAHLDELEALAVTPIAKARDEYSAAIEAAVSACAAAASGLSDAVGLAGFVEDIAKGTDVGVAAAPALDIERIDVARAAYSVKQVGDLLSLMQDGVPREPAQVDVRVVRNGNVIRIATSAARALAAAGDVVIIDELAARVTPQASKTGGPGVAAH